MVASCLVSERADLATVGGNPGSHHGFDGSSRIAQFDGYRGGAVVIADEPGESADPAGEMLTESRRAIPPMLPENSREFLRSRVQDSGE